MSESGSPRDSWGESSVYLGRYDLLFSLHDVLGLHALPDGRLPVLAQQVRDYIIDQVSVHPGHLGASLGVVDLTVALLSVYDVNQDAIVWDVGHQAYAYKILTGRRVAFTTNRQWGGISGFPRRAESRFDVFGTGHSSTSISAALGIADGRLLLGGEGHTIAVIGDGALTGGMAYEGLNNAGASGADLLVILNDNNMSIDPNVGAMSEYLLDLTTSPGYNRMKDGVWTAMERLGMGGKRGLRSATQRINQGLKGALLQQSNLFEGLGFRYFGPVDGHDLVYLKQVLTDLKRIRGPKLLHCITRKGKGYAPAEADQTLWHAPGRFDPVSGIRIPGGGKMSRPYQDVFADTLLDIMESHPRVVGITAAMPTGSSLKRVMDRYPSRTRDVGIAEGHAVTYAAGLATQGVIPFCVIYSSFLQRGYDQLIHDVALQNLHVVFCIDRGGLVGADGPTHHGVFDLAYLRSIPNFTVCVAASAPELEAMMRLALLGSGPWAIRYARGASWRDGETEGFQSVKRGGGVMERAGSGAAILALGSGVEESCRAAEAMELAGATPPSVYNLRFAKPLDMDLIAHVAGAYERVYVVEDGVLSGGVGEAIAAELLRLGYRGDFERIGVGDEFIPHGGVGELRDYCGFSAPALVQRLTADAQRIEREKRVAVPVMLPQAVRVGRAARSVRTEG